MSDRLVRASGTSHVSAPLGEPERGTGLTIGIGLLVTGFFVLLYPALHLRVPVGSDSPVYVWWARYAGTSGFGPLETGARPAVVGLLATLATVTRSQVAAVVEALGPVLAASLALTAAVLTRGSVRHPRPRLAFTLVASLVGVFLSFVVPGYLSTLAFLAPFLTALAVLALGAGRDGVAVPVAAGLLLATAGLSHPLFLLLAGGVCIGVAVSLIPAFIASRHDEVTIRQTALGRLALAWAFALPSVGLGLAASGVGTGAAVYTSRDAVLRRTGLGALLKASYARKLHHDVPWWRAISVVGLALTALPLFPGQPAGPETDAVASKPIPAAERERSATFWGTIATWLLITLGGVAMLVFGLSAAPGQRLIDVCLPLPIMSGLGLAAVRFRRRWLSAAAITAGVILFVITIGSAWVANRPLSTPEQIEQARAVGAALATTRPTTPLVVVMDKGGDKPALFITRWENDLRGAVPGGRVPDVHVFVGTPKDLLAGRPGQTGLAEHDRLALGYWARIRPLLHRQPLVVSVQGFDPVGFRAAAAMSGSRSIAPGVIVLPGFASPVGNGSGLPGSLSRPGAGPLSPWSPVWLAVVLLAGMAAIGWPWARLSLPAADRSDVLALAPAFGAAALPLAAVAADAIGLRLSGVGALVALAASTVGWLALALERRGARSGARRPPPTSESPAAEAAQGMGE